jgi:hypothetical protein
MLQSAPDSGNRLALCVSMTLVYARAAGDE